MSLAAKRSSHTTIGDATKLSARLYSAIQDGRILDDQKTYLLVKNQVMTKLISEMIFKGLGDEIPVYKS